MCPIGVDAPPQEHLPISSSPIIYALMFASGNDQLFPESTPSFIPKGSPTMVCETEARAFHELYLKVGWAVPMGNDVRVEFPQVLASGRLSCGVLVLTTQADRSKGYQRWYSWWVEELRLVA
jgi:hypothetical protein